MNIARRHLVLVGLKTDMVNRIRNAVGTHGTEYHVAKDQFEALGLVEKFEPSVVITAERLLDGDAFMLCERIKKDQRNRGVAVVVLTLPGTAYNHGKGALAGVDYNLESSAQEDLLSDAILDLAEKTEKSYPLYARRGNRMADAPSAYNDASELILSDRQYDAEKRETFFQVNPKSIETREGNGTGPGLNLYHGFGDEEPANPPAVEPDPLITHGIAEETNEERENERELDNEYKDPIDDFFSGQDDAVAGGLPKSLAPRSDFSHLAAKRTTPLRVSSPLQSGVAAIGPQVADEITRAIDDWLRTVLGRKVDEALLIEGRNTLSPLVLRTVDRAIRQACKD